MSQRTPGELLADQGMFQETEAQAAMRLWDLRCPESLLTYPLSLLLELGDQLPEGYLLP